MKRGSQSDKPPKPPAGGWFSPESVQQLDPRHVRILQKMLNHRLGRWGEGTQHVFIKAEIGALAAAIAVLNEVLDQKGLTNDQ